MRRPLESVRDLKDTKIVAVTADDLNSDGEAVGGETGGNGNRRTERRADPVRRFHPGKIVVHRDAVDLARPVEVGIEGGNLIYAAKQKLIFLLKYPHALHELAVARH